MARIPESEIERLKADVSVQRLVEARGIDLARHGADWLGRCPFHADKTPSLVVSPAKNLWHCLGACQIGGGPIDWVMKADGVSFRHAVELLREGMPAESSSDRVVHASTVPKLPAPVSSEVDDRALLRQVIDYYHATLKQSPEALAYLQSRGLNHPELIERFALGFANRTLGVRLPEKNRKAGADIRTERVSPDTGTHTDTYDAAGNRLTHTDARGVVSRSDYDALNRWTRTRYPDNTLNVSVGYDEPDSVTGCTGSAAIGRLTRIVEQSVTTVYCYSPRGKVVQKRQITAGHVDTTRYAYTLADRLSSITTPDHILVSYAYNADGHPRKIKVTPSGASSPSKVVSRITWLPFGPISSYKLGNGQQVTRSYDANYRLTDLTSPALNLHFARDASGDISALGNTPGASPATETYHYDPLYRLKRLTEANGSTLEKYTYNKTGDRLSKTATHQVTGAGIYSYTPGSHRLASIGNGARSHDANGDTTGSVMGGNAYRFHYNDRDRLAVAKLNRQKVGIYTTNALGQRIGKVATFPQAVTQRYAYNEAGQLIGEYGTTNRDYIWLGNIPLAVIDNTINGNVTTSTVNYITADQLGTPRAVSNHAGTVIWSWAYQGNPFGEQLPTSATGYVLNLRYPGQYFDAETNTSYNYFRTYEAATGRYLQSDPIGLGGGVSTYAYVGGNPLMYTDPYGLAWQATLGLGGEAGFLFGFGGGGGSVSINSNLSLTFSAEGHGEVGLGLWLGVGATGGISHTKCDPKQGFSKDNQAILEANLGAGKAVGGVLTANRNGIGGSTGLPRVGIGAGIMVAGGLSHSVSYTTETIPQMWNNLWH